MAAYETRTILDCTVEEAWELVTNLEKQMDWRDDLKEIEILNSKQYTEDTKDGYSTYYNVVRVEENKQWQRTFENENLEGYSKYIFIPKGNKTEFVMCERATTSKLLMKLYVGNYLKSRQYFYIQNLKEVLGQK